MNLHPALLLSAQPAICLQLHESDYKDNADDKDAQTVTSNNTTAKEPHAQKPNTATVTGSAGGVPNRSTNLHALSQRTVYPAEPSRWFMFFYIQLAFNAQTPIHGHDTV